MTSYWNNPLLANVEQLRNFDHVPIQCSDYLFCMHFVQVLGRYDGGRWSLVSSSTFRSRIVLSCTEADFRTALAALVLRDAVPVLEQQKKYPEMAALATQNLGQGDALAECALQAAMDTTKDQLRESLRQQGSSSPSGPKFKFCVQLAGSSP